MSKIAYESTPHEASLRDIADKLRELSYTYYRFANEVMQHGQGDPNVVHDAIKLHRKMGARARRIELHGRVA